MEIHTSMAGLVPIAAIVGDIDARTVLKTQETLVPLVQPGSKILLDLSRVEYMSSAGLRMLLSLYRQVAGADGSLALAGLSENIKETMAVTGFLRFFTIYEAVEAALAAMA